MLIANSVPKLRRQFEQWRSRSISLGSLSVSSFPAKFDLGTLSLRDWLLRRYERSDTYWGILSRHKILTGSFGGYSHEQNRFPLLHFDFFLLHGNLGIRFIWMVLDSCRVQACIIQSVNLLKRRWVKLTKA